MTIVVPRGAEAAAVRSANVALRIVEVAAGKRAAVSLPTDIAGPVVVVGLCGALRDCTVGDVVVYRSIHHGARTIALDAGYASVIRARLPDAHDVSAYSADHVVTTVAERVELAIHYDVDVVDMEGASLAAELARRRLRFAMVRVVSDDASRDLPALTGAIGADGRLDIPRIALAFVRRPRTALAFVRDVRTALATLTVTAGKLSP